MRDFVDIVGPMSEAGYIVNISGTSFHPMGLKEKLGSGYFRDHRVYKWRSKRPWSLMVFEIHLCS